MNPRARAGLVLVLVLLTARAARAGGDDLAARIDAYLAPYAAAGQLSGNLLLTRGDTVLYERSFGTTTCGGDTAITPGTPFCVAAVTEDMTRVVAIALMQSGLLQPGTLVTDVVPRFPEGDTITFTDVLRHRAGFPRRVTTPDQETVPHTSEDMVRRLGVQVGMRGLLFEPGSDSRESAAGYTLAARMCEIAAGKPFPELLRTLVFDPAGMDGAFDPVPGKPLPPHAVGCLAAWPGCRPAPARDYTFLEGAGSVFATARDLQRFLKAAVDTVYGVGVRRSLVQGGNIVGDGLTDGYEAIADWHGIDDLYLVYAANIRTGAAARLRQDLPRLVRGEAVPVPTLPAVAPVPLPADAEQRYGGRWVSDRADNFTLAATDGLLTAGDWTLVPESPTTFFSPQDYTTVTFTLEGDRAVRLSRPTDDGVLVWTRVAR